MLGRPLRDSATQLFTYLRPVSHPIFLPFASALHATIACFRATSSALETRAAAAGEGMKAVAIASTMEIMHVDSAAAKRDIMHLLGCSSATNLFCELPNRAASPASGSFDQASHQSFSQLLPLPVVCSSLLTFVSCHSLKSRISKSQPQRPEQCNTRRRDVSLLRISEKASALLRLRVLTSTRLAPFSLQDVFTSRLVAIHALHPSTHALTSQASSSFC